jgi:hypothetical protein
MARRAATGHAYAMLPLGRGPRLLEQAEEPIELLVACHGRIRHFSEVALRLARGAGHPLDQIVEAAIGVHRYFSVALPLHERDEEESIAPRLLESAARSEVQDVLARMKDEHRAIDALLEETMPLWQRVAAAPEVIASHANELEERAVRIAALFEPHLALEEGTLFPAIARALPKATRVVLLQEIRGRRTPEVRAQMVALRH